MGLGQGSGCPLGWAAPVLEKQVPAIPTAPHSRGPPTPGPQRLLEEAPSAYISWTTWAACFAAGPGARAVFTGF